MAKLVLHSKEGAEREIPLDRQRVTIGRQADNDLSVNDKATSSHHAVIITIGRNSYLQDLKSTNGTLVNGKPVQKHTLRHGDVILIGRNHLSYVDTPESKPTAEAPGDSPASKANGAPSKVADAAAKPPPSSATGRLNPEATISEKPQPATKYAPWEEHLDEGATPKDMVDNMLEAIRSHRTYERTLQTRRKESLNQEWKKLIEATTTLKKRIAGNPRVKFFDIARDQSEILIRIQREGRKTGQHSILIARNHPHNPSPTETIWLIESGEPEKNHDSCEDVMRSVMRTLAPLIA